MTTEPFEALRALPSCRAYDRRCVERFVATGAAARLATERDLAAALARAAVAEERRTEEAGVERQLATMLLRAQRVIADEEQTNQAAIQGILVVAERQARHLVESARARAAALRVDASGSLRSGLRHTAGSTGDGANQRHLAS